MSFMLERQPIGNKGEPLAEATYTVVDFSEVVRFLMTIFDPSMLARIDRQTRTELLEVDRLTLLHQEAFDFAPLREEGAIVDGCLWWRYDFREQPDEHDMNVLANLITVHAKAWSEQYPWAFQGIRNQLKSKIGRQAIRSAAMKASPGLLPPRSGG